MGYHQAGFEVVGVDHNPQPNYPFKFYQMGWEDALKKLDLSEFDVIHASPPCQGYSVTKSLSKSTAPKLINEVRRQLQAIGKPYVIENVPGAKRELINPLVLRGNMFGLRVIRDRYFETDPWLMCSLVVPVDGSTGSHRGMSTLSKGGYITVAGHNFKVEEARYAMGCPWMNQKELAQAIPPAYTEWIGQQLKAICFDAAA